MAVGIILALIYMVALVIFSVLMWPIRKIWENADANPKRTAKTMIFLTSAVLLINAFGLPWKLDILFNGKSFVALLGGLGDASAGAFVAMVLFGFFFVFFGLPLLLLKFVSVAFGYSRANSSFFWKLLLVGFVAAAAEFWVRGFVTIRFAVYGLGAYVIFNYYRILMRC